VVEVSVYAGRDSLHLAGKRSVEPLKHSAKETNLAAEAPAGLRIDKLQIGRK